VRAAETLLSGWAWTLLPAIALTVTAAAYLAATARVDRRQPWPASRTAYFLAGTATLWIAILGPPGYFDDVFFYAHMTQHILLTMVAAPLLVLGDPVLLGLRVASRPVRKRWLVPLYRSKVVEVLTNPVLGWFLFVGVMAVTHIPSVYDYALTHPLVHDYVEHPLYLASALLYFYPLLAATSGRRNVAYGIRAISLFTMMIPTAFIGFFIYARPHLAYPFYAHVDRPFGPDPLTDQQLSGALMWSSAMILGAVWFCVVGLRWLQAEERRSHRVDRAVARSVTAAHETRRAGPAS
jgi:cytochrome c oxidase assembly factor CtaG